MKKLTLLFAVIFLLSCKKSHKPIVTAIYDNHFELLSGKVKQIAEISNRLYSGMDTVIIDFDKQGKITQFKTGGNRVVKCEYKYDKTGNPTEVTEKFGLFPVVYKYDKGGRIIESNQYTKELRENSDHILKQDKYFFKYNGDRQVIQTDYYFDTEHRLIEKYKYSDQHLLIETKLFSDKGYLQEKAFYQYISIDDKGNWLKRIKKSVWKPDTITRKIIYY